MSVKIEVWGDWASFNRPELKVERVSYDVMTPSAARGILDAIYWHPGMVWRIDRIHVINPIRFTSIRRNEVKDKINARKVQKVMEHGGGDLRLVPADNIMQRSAMVLRDVRYVIEAHFDMTKKASPSDNQGKFSEIIRTRLAKGRYFHQPYFGVREYPVHFKKCEEIPPCAEELRGHKDLGLMLFDMDYSSTKNITPMFFRAELNDGVLNVPAFDSREVLR